MCPKQLFAVPIQEGIVEICSNSHVAWRDYRWNTGEIVRRWFVNSDKVQGKRILVQAISEITIDGLDQ